MPRMKIYDEETQQWIALDANDAETVNGKRAEDFASIYHVGKGGREHAEATKEEAGFLSAEDKKKLDKLLLGEGGSEGSVAFLNKEGRVKDSEKVGGKSLTDLDARYKYKREVGEHIVYAMGQKEIPITVADFDGAKDKLNVYQDGTRLQPGINYSLDTSKSTISLLEYVAEWGTEFHFEVEKGIAE